MGYLCFRPTVEDLLSSGGDHVLLRDRRTGDETRIQIEPRGGKVMIAIHAPAHVQIIGPPAMRREHRRRAALGRSRWSDRSRKGQAT